MKMLRVVSRGLAVQRAPSGSVIGREPDCSNNHTVECRVEVLVMRKVLFIVKIVF